MKSKNNHQVVTRYFSYLVICFAMLPVGCSEYRLRGIVISGDVQRVLVVDDTNPSLEQGGLIGAVIDLTLDPRSLKPRPLLSGMTDAQGRFDIPIDVVGAGLLEYELSLMCSLKGYGCTYQEIQKPAGNRRLVVVMVKGGRSQGPPRDPLRDSLRIHDQLMRSESN